MPLRTGVGGLLLLCRAGLAASNSVDGPTVVQEEEEVRWQAKSHDVSALVQQAARRQLTPHNWNPLANVTCPALPTPLHYDYGKYAGAYSRRTVLWTDGEFQAVFAAERQGNQEPLIPLMQKLQRGESVRMVVLGGSSTAGAGCFQGAVVAKECAWPRRFQHWLQLAFPEGKVELFNFAQGAATSSSLLAGAALMLRRGADADIIFVDTLVNDVYQWQKGTFGSLDEDRNAAMAFEQLLRTLHRLEPQAVIYPVLSGCKSCMRHGAGHRDVVAHYDLALLDWGNFAAVKAHLWEVSDVHPPYYTHQSMADVLATQWSATWQKYCARPQDAGTSVGEWPPPHFDQAKLDAFTPCEAPLSGYDASMPETTQDVELGAGWRYYEDQPGKPGWISETPGSEVVFPVKFGPHPVLVITWVRSYETMGTATVLLNGHEYTLDGLWPPEFQERVSLAYSRWLQVDSPSIQKGSKEVGVAGFGIKPWTKTSLRIRLPQGLDEHLRKMKIVQVFTC